MSRRKRSLIDARWTPISSSTYKESNDTAEREKYWRTPIYLVRFHGETKPL